ncbi:MAG: AMP phosphorylase [Thermoproteota archaeon]|nr:MAG: AMP phosphorylase [Candidatus Korarchaeota archaeon]RLG48667.1 MAG: AMP phosphorylase [Candidatus Korarchaeota archaeon]
MKLKVKPLGFSVGRRLVLINEKDATSQGMRMNDRVKVEHKKRRASAFLSISGSHVEPGVAALSQEVMEILEVEEGDIIALSLSGRPPSFSYIKKKMEGQKLLPEEIRSIIEDAVNYNLTDLEIAAFLLSQEFYGMSMDEIEALTKAMVETGERIDFGRPAFEKHSIGGVPGNKVSLLIVPIVASLGVLIPKTSSRAITSPTGTADTMEVLAPVEFTADEFREIALKVGGAIVWGGRLGLAPTDDIFIRVEHPLGIDPRGQMLASIMSKKLATGTKALVIDIPTGKGAKVENVEEAELLSSQFVELGRRFGVRVQCGITYGGQPVGHAIGPALEAKEALEALQGKGPASLIEKSTSLAGMLLEMAGVTTRGSGKELAEEVLASGKALKKMREIIEAQGGNPGVKPEDIPLGQYTTEIRAPCDGYVTDVDNHSIKEIALAAGAPAEKGAGVLLHAKVGYKVEKGDPLMTIYAERESKLTEAYNVAMRTKPITVEGMLLRRIPDYT